MTKISKRVQKQQFRSLIELLKPKVYITDSSNFKQLVQELTGNGNSNARTASEEVGQGVHVPLTPCNPIIHDHMNCQSQYRSRSSSASVEASSLNKNCFPFDHHQHPQSEDQYCQSSREISSFIHASTSSLISSYTTNNSADYQDYDLSNLQFCANDTALQEHSRSNELVDLFAYQEIGSVLEETSSIYNWFSNQ